MPTLGNIHELKEAVNPAWESIPAATTTADDSSFALANNSSQTTQTTVRCMRTHIHFAWRDFQLAFDDSDSIFPTLILCCLALPIPYTKATYKSEWCTYRYYLLQWRRKSLKSATQSASAITAHYSLIITPCHASANKTHNSFIATLYDSCLSITCGLCVISVLLSLLLLIPCNFDSFIPRGN